MIKYQIGFNEDGKILGWVDGSHVPRIGETVTLNIPKYKDDYVVEDVRNHVAPKLGGLETEFVSQSPLVLLKR